MVFIEAAPFTKYLRDYLNDDEYGELQSFLIEQPEAGDLIQGTGGLRKLRWSSWTIRVSVGELGLFIIGKFQKTKFISLPFTRKTKYPIYRVMKRKH